MVNNMNKNIKIKIKGYKEYDKVVEELNIIMQPVYKELIKVYEGLVDKLTNLINNFREVYEALDCPYGEGDENMFRYFYDEIDRIDKEKEIRNRKNGLSERIIDNNGKVSFNQVGRI
jgi:hypothetical protein